MNITHRVAPGFVPADQIHAGDVIRYAGETVKVLVRESGNVQVRLTVRPVDCTHARRDCAHVRPVAVIHGTAAVRRLLTVAR